jgi:hypothetical protein
MVAVKCKHFFVDTSFIKFLFLLHIVMQIWFLSIIMISVAPLCLDFVKSRLLHVLTKRYMLRHSVG